MVLTGSVDPTHAASFAAGLGATSFVSKPVTKEALVVAVQALGFVVMSSAIAGNLGSRTIERRWSDAALGVVPTISPRLAALVINRS